MRLVITKHWQRYGGIFTLVFFALHWGNRTIGLTLFNVVIEIEY